MFLTLIAFIIIFSLVILIHEAGHFFAAKKSGAKVEEFGIGYPPRIWGKKKGETIYSINWIPFGGFVKILGENMEEDKKDDSRSFASKSIGKRFWMISAGIIMNILLAIVLFSIGNIIGIPQQLGESLPSYAHIQEGSIQIQITDIVENSPAKEFGLEAGDYIKEIKLPSGESRKISSAEDVKNISSEYKGQEIVLQLQRGEETIEKTLVPRVEFPDNEGPIGISLFESAIVSYPWYLSLYRGIIDTYNIIVLFLVLFFGIIKSLLLSGRPGVEVTGPVGIAVMTGQVAQMGMIYIIQFTALLSVNLAIVNGLPLPALDGGRLLFLVIEKIKGSPVKKNVENIVHTAGFFLLIALMILVTYKDIVRYFF